MRIIAARLGTDPVVDLRPEAAVAAGSGMLIAGMLIAAMQTWAAGADATALPRLVDAFFDTLLGLTAEAQDKESPS